MPHTHYRILPYTVVPGEDLFSLDRLVYFDAVDVRSTAVSDLRFYTPGDVALDWMNVSAVLTGSTVTGWVRIVLPSQLASAETTDELIRVRYGGTPDIGSVAASTTLSLSGLVGAWDCESTSPADWSGGGNNGSGTNLTSTAGAVASAENFNGTNAYLSVGDSDAFSFTSGGFTIEMWLSRDRAANGIDDLFNKALQPNTNEYEAGFYSDSLIYFDLFSEGSGLKVIGRTAPAFGADGRHHLAFTYSGGGTPTALKIIKDGVQIDNASRSQGTFTAPTNTSQPLYFGRTSSFYGAYFSGWQDDIRVWSRPLSIAEIAYQVAQADPLNSEWGAEIALSTAVYRPTWGRGLRRGTRPVYGGLFTRR